MGDTIGLYLATPENADVLCVDEKSQVAALNRTRRCCQCRPAMPSNVPTTDLHHGSTTQFAMLEIATGQGYRAVKNRHRHQELMTFLKDLAQTCPDRGHGAELHLSQHKGARGAWRRSASRQMSSA